MNDLSDHETRLSNETTTRTVPPCWWELREEGRRSSEWLHTRAWFWRGANPRGDNARPPSVVIMAATLSEYFPIPLRDIAPPQCGGKSRLPFPPVAVTLRRAVDILPSLSFSLPPHAEGTPFWKLLRHFPSPDCESAKEAQVDDPCVQESRNKWVKQAYGEALNKRDGEERSRIGINLAQNKNEMLNGIVVAGGILNNFTSLMKSFIKRCMPEKGYVLIPMLLWCHSIEK